MALFPDVCIYVSYLYNGGLRSYPNLRLHSFDFAFFFRYDSNEGGRAPALYSTKRGQ